jgi:hypothetical protein
MPTYPPVKITKPQSKPSDSKGPEARLGARNEQEKAIQADTTGLLGKLAELATEIYLLEWEGGKIPRGAVLNGKEIGWTQHGMVTSTTGEMMGTYERSVEFGGANKQEQKMLVFLNCQASTQAA